MENRSILLVDSDKDSAKEMKQMLQTYGYTITVAHDELDAINFLVKGIFELILCDISTKSTFGLEVISRFKEKAKNIPLIVITNRQEVETKIIAFNSGANDLIVKPYNNFELIARISNQIRNVKKETGIVFKNGELLIDLDKRLVLLNNQEVHLTNIEYKILVLLSKNLDRIVPYDEIIEEIWGKGGQDYNGLRVFMSGIRNKLRGTKKKTSLLIRTQVNVGYRMKKVD